MHNDRELVVAGTVFRSILVWQAHQGQVEQADNVPTAQVLYRLEGHTGVIFDTRFMNNSLDIVSVSDDRSVRVWKHPGENGTEYS